MHDNPDISDELLLKLAGQKAFALGKAYFEQALILELETRGKTTTARVNGDQPGRVRLHYTRKGLEGSCDCPVSDGIDFCEHCVATALALRALKSKPVLKTSARPTEVLTTYFERQSKEHLVNTLVELINGDKPLRQKWLLQADQALGRLDKRALRKRITSVIPYKASIHRYHRVKKYFLDIGKALEELKNPIEMLPADQQIELIGYALERLDKATDTVDDSGGFRFPALDLLQTMYRSAFARLKWHDYQKVEHLIGLMISDKYGFYGVIPDDYREAMGPEVFTLFIQKVQEQWDALPPRQASWIGIDRNYLTRLRVLRTEAQKAGDYAQLIELHHKVAVTETDFLKLAEWCLEIADYPRAQSYLDKATATPDFVDADRVEELQLAISQGLNQSGPGTR